MLEHLEMYPHYGKSVFIMLITLFLPVYMLFFEIYIVWYSYSHSRFLVVRVGIVYMYFLYHFTFHLLMSLYLKCILHRWSFQLNLVHSAYNLWLLVTIFRPFTFNVIVDRIRFKFIPFLFAFSVQPIFLFLPLFGLFVVIQFFFPPFVDY